MILKSTRLNGVYYRESEQKKINGKPDRCFYIKYYHNKRQIQEKVGWLSEGFSSQVAADVRLKRLSGEQKKVDLSLSFDDAALIYIEWAKYNKKTWLNDLQRYNKHIKNFLGDRKLVDIKTPNIHDFVAELNNYKIRDGQKYSKQSIHHYVVLISRIFSFMITTERFAGNNPAVQKKLQMPKFDCSRNVYLAEDEIERYIIACDDTELFPENVGALFKFALFTGLRRSEVFNLKWSNIDFERGFIYLVDTKGRKNQSIVLSSLALEVLKNTDPIVGVDYVFPSKLNVKRKEIRDYWDKLKESACIRSDVHFHDIRHTFGTIAVTAGIPLDVLQKMMTHKDIKTTQRYAHIVDKRLHDAANVIDSAFKGLSIEPVRVGDEVKSRAKKRKNEGI